MRYVSFYKSPLGKIILGSDGEKLTGLWFEAQKYFSAEFVTNAEERVLPIFIKTKQWLDIYFSGQEPDFRPQILLVDSDFRLDVWQILLDIPYGYTMTYGDIALQVAKKRGMRQMSAQAIGGAVGHNPISLIVPCHRVLGARGSLTGYAGGVERKRQLLRLEKSGIELY